MTNRIATVLARQLWDSRGRPTVDRVVMEFPLAHGRASPRFASLGKLSECGMRFLILHNAG